MSTPHDNWDQDERQALAGLEGQLDAIRRRHEQDPSLDLLRAAQADALPPEMQRRVASHLQSSAWSRALVEGVTDGEADAGLDAAAEDRLFARITREAAVAGAQPARWRRPAVLGGLALAASLLITVFLVRGRPGQEPVPGPAPSAAQVPAPAVGPPAAPPLQLAFAKPDVKLSAAALSWRGTPSDNPFLLDLKPAFDAYRGGDYRRATTAFDGLRRKYPDSIEVLFYQGASHMLDGDFEGALAPLTAAARLRNDLFADDASWLLAVAEQRTGRTTESRSRLADLCRGTGRHAAEACAAAGQIDARALQAPAKKP